MLEEELDQINIEDELFKVIGSKLSREIIERINKNMTYVLQTVRKKIKGPGRNVPFSKIKAKRRATYLYQKATEKQIKGKWVNEIAMERRREDAKIGEQEVIINKEIA